MRRLNLSEKTHLGMMMMMVVKVTVVMLMMMMVMVMLMVMVMVLMVMMMFSDFLSEEQVCVSTKQRITSLQGQGRKRGVRIRRVTSSPL
jgi:hypothetical protein